MDTASIRRTWFSVANPYDVIAYRTLPRRQTHPDRLAAVATLFGMTPAPVTRCRVLEIGCGNGGNLIPLAYHLPDSHFVGVDLAGTAIRAARKAVRDLKLRHVELRAADLRTLGASDGKFDYILAHGVYSWVPAEVRDALLAICRERLTPQGVALVSYNVFPGRYARYALREMLLWATRGIADPRGRITTARRFRETEALPEDVLFHDDLAPVNDPSWFHEFVAHAAKHRLQFLGEADPHEMFDLRGRLQDVDGEQREDWRKQRSFRQTLLCRSEVALRRRARAGQMDHFLFTENPHGHRVSGGEAVAQALHDAAPLPVAFDELVPYAGGRRALREALFSLLRAGCVDIHVHDFPCQESAGQRPRASVLARYQAASSDVVTNACHVLVRLRPRMRRVLRELDGTRRCPAEAGAWLAQMGLLE
jgi:SAM-dependent methyltransferase